MHSYVSDALDEKLHEIAYLNLSNMCYVVAHDLWNEWNENIPKSLYKELDKKTHDSLGPIKLGED